MRYLVIFMVLSGLLSSLPVMADKPASAGKGKPEMDEGGMYPNKKHAAKGKESGDRIREEEREKIRREEQERIEERERESMHKGDGDGKQSAMQKQREMKEA